MNTSINYKRFFISFAAVLVIILCGDYLVHNMILVDMYKNTISIWRPAESMLFWPMFVSQTAFALMFVFIFTLNYENKGLPEGLRFGAYIGLLLAAINFGSYSYLPVPLFMVFAWMVASLLKCMVIGFVTAVFYRK